MRWRVGIRKQPERRQKMTSMMNQGISDAGRPTTVNVNQLGLYTALLTTVVTLVTFGSAVFTPPLAGPYCTGACFDYPYTEIVSRFPRDYLWMYPAMLLCVLYVVFMVSIHQYAAPDKQLFSQIGLSFALMAATILLVAYFTQVSVIQPSLVEGETEGLALLTQFNPHGIFIALEEIGFLLMSLSFLWMAPVFSGAQRTETAIRWLFRVSFLATILAFLYYALQYGLARDYRFEVAVITINWIVLIVAGILVSLVFKRALACDPHAGS
jgi:hypothetical protein